MNTKLNVLLLTACLILVGCAKTRSISNATYRDESNGYNRPNSTHDADPGFAYQGELNEFDVLAVDRNKLVSEEDISRALEQAKAIKLSPGSAILLVQSGAVFPDAPMVDALSKHFRVTPFSGVPPKHRTATDAEPMEAVSYSRSLRLAAARAGAENIVCYWGILESARRNMETKTVSWVPLAGWLVPDEAQSMRIRLKLALIDVRTGSWTVVCPEASEDKAWSTRYNRGSSDQKQVEALKQKAYAASATALAKLN